MVPHIAVRANEQHLPEEALPNMAHEHLAVDQRQTSKHSVVDGSVFRFVCMIHYGKAGSFRRWREIDVNTMDRRCIYRKRKRSGFS